MFHTDTEHFVMVKREDHKDSCNFVHRITDRRKLRWIKDGFV